MGIIIKEHEWTIHESTNMEDYNDYVADESARRITIREGLHPECRMEAIIEAVLEVSTEEWMAVEARSLLSHTIAQVLYNRFLYRSEQERGE